MQCDEHFECSSWPLFVRDIEKLKFSRALTLLSVARCAASAGVLIAPMLLIKTVSLSKLNNDAANSGANTETDIYHAGSGGN